MRFAAEYGHAAAGGPGETGDNTEQRGLPRTVTAQEREASAGLGGDGDLAQGGIVAEELPDVLNGDRAHFLGAVIELRDNAKDPRPRAARPRARIQYLVGICSTLLA